MTRDTLFLQLLANDIRSLHASALALEKDLHRLSLEIDSDNIDSLAGLIAQINCAGFAPIDKMLCDAGMPPSKEVPVESSALSGVLAETGATLRRSESRRLGTANAISIMRRAARYMEMYCSSIADSAMRLRLTKLAEHLRAWAREWIGLELNLNAVAARPRESVRMRMREEAVFAA